MSSSPLSSPPPPPTTPPALSRPLSLATNVSVELGGYQVALEEVLTWLLEAEDVLNHASEPGSNLEELKRQFHEHESFLMELSGHQDGVGAVLEEGERLLAEGGLQKDEEHEVRVQMSLLNSRWENLRKRALDRQSKIHQVRRSIARWLRVIYFISDMFRCRLVFDFRLVSKFVIIIYLLRFVNIDWRYLKVKIL